MSWWFPGADCHTFLLSAGGAVPAQPLQKGGAQASLWHAAIIWLLALEMTEWLFHWAEIMSAAALDFPLEV